jgi:hypothetical protein
VPHLRMPTPVLPQRHAAPTWPRPACALGALGLLATVSACDFTGSDGPDEGGPLGGSFSVTGDVVDFRTGQPVLGATLSTSGLQPAREITVDGATFSLDGIPTNSAFQLSASAPAHLLTFSPAILVEEDDVEGASAPLVSEEFLDDLREGFDVDPDPAKGVLLVRVVGADGQPRARIPAASLLLSVAGAAPRVLGADLSATADLSTSASGWVAFFGLPPGVVSLGQSATATLTLEMATSPIAAGAVTLATATATDGAPPMLRNVSFSRDVVPIFAARRCTECHSGGGIGKDLGGLDLGGGASKIYKELLEEDPTRVRPNMPEASLIITMPSRESPPDGHPNSTFTSPADRDFQKLYVWIREGAKQN